MKLVWNGEILSSHSKVDLLLKKLFYLLNEYVGRLLSFFILSWFSPPASLLYTIHTRYVIPLHQQKSESIHIVAVLNFIIDPGEVQFENCTTLPKEEKYG